LQNTLNKNAWQEYDPNSDYENAVAERINGILKFMIDKYNLDLK
jgi:hypothetical protein